MFRAPRFAWTCLLLLFAVPSASAQNDVLTPHHVGKMRVVTEAVISPNGEHVAYVLSVPRDLTKEKDGGSWGELHVVDVKGNSKPFITGPVNVAALAWTPDGKEIAFLAKRDKDEARSLYVIPLAGGEARKLVGHAADIQGFSFSGDGSQVAFLAAEPVPAAKKKQKEQGFNQEIYEEDQPFTRVWIAPTADPSNPKKLKLDGSASELHFNPKEDKIAVALAPTPYIDDSLMFRKVHIVDLKTEKATNLDNPGKLGQVAWSPDGKKLAMITGADKHDPKEGRVWIASANGKWSDILNDENTEPRLGLRSRNRRIHVESFCWDATIPGRLHALESEGIESHLSIYTIQQKPEGGFEVGGTAGLTWNFASKGHVFSHSSCNPRGNVVACIGQTAHHPPEVYLFDGKGDDSPRRLTDSNPWLKSIKLAKQEVVKYMARDGLELEGVLIRPLNEEKGKKYPLVLTVHGGPEAHYANGWVTLYHSLGQVAAAKGMAVFYPNYRGSTGYGVEFSMKGQKDAGGKEFDDLIDGVDHLIKIGLVDKKKVGITGGSYGGYATAWGSTYYSDRFAAGVMFVGISDWISCMGTTDIPQEMFLVHHRKWLWDDWDYFAKASPVKHLDKAKTPLLILHVKNDPRVHPSQSLELHRHLKVRGQAPVRLVLYPDEGHGNRRTASRLDYNLRLLQWMEHYLKGPGGAMPPLDLDYGLAPSPKTASAGWNDRAPATEATCQHALFERGCPACIGR
jgi:dipeptidyl aminopeptidase/acylaminoacyl peptidase